jgi:hypothetical protein
MPATKTESKELLKEDYIPGGKRIDITNIEFRRTEEHEVFRCCAITGNDVQSGPFYCGSIAEWVCETDDGIVCVARGVTTLLKK